MLIEPAPQKYMECLERRGLNNKVFCNACVDNSYDDRFVELSYANLMTTALSANSQQKNVDLHFKNASKNMPKHQEVFKFAAIAATLSSILEQANAPEVIDFLSLDVEGFELDVLKVIDNFLKNHGYELIDELSFHDFFVC